MTSSRFKTPFFLHLVLLFLFTLPYSCEIVTASDFHIKDLYSSTSYFLEELKYWKTDSGAEVPYIHCDGFYLLGTSDLTAQSARYIRTYNNLANHNFIGINILFYLFGLWIVTPSIRVDIHSSGASIGFLQFRVNNLGTAFPQTISCGSNIANYRQENMILYYPHTDTELDLTIASTFFTNVKGAWFGMKSIDLILKDGFFAYSGSCMVPYFTGDPTYQKCGCSFGLHTEITPDCIPCHPACKNCYESTASSDCISCNDGYVFDGTDCIPCDTSTCSTCFGPLANQCISCPTGRYLYNNTLCIACLPPMQVKQDNGVDVCRHPCPDPTYYYYPKNKSCYATCNWPGIILQTEYINSCDLGDDSLLEMLAPAVNSASKTTTIGLLFITFVMPTNPTNILFSLLSDILLYIRYLDVSYTSELEDMFQNTWSPAIPFANALAMTQSMQNNFQQAKMPNFFAINGLSSNYIINFWNDMVLLGFIFCPFIIVYVLYHYSKEKNTRATRVAKSLRIWLQNSLWNTFYSNYGDIMLFAMLEVSLYDSMASGTHYDTISLISSIFFLANGVILLLIHFSMISTRLNINKLPDTSRELQLDKFVKSYAGFQFMIEGLEETSRWKLSFLLFFIIRVILSNVILGVLYKYPLVQIVLLTGLNICAILYLCLVRPYKSKMNFIPQVVAEIIILVVNISVLVQAAIDYREQPYRTPRRFMSKVVIVCSLFFHILTCLFMVVKCIIFARRIYVSYRKKTMVVHGLSNTAEGNIGNLSNDELSKKSISEKKPPESSNVDELDQENKGSAFITTEGLRRRRDLQRSPLKIARESEEVSLEKSNQEVFQEGEERDQSFLQLLDDSAMSNVKSQLHKNAEVFQLKTEFVCIKPTNSSMFDSK